MSVEPQWMWYAFGAFITLMLWLDLAVFNKKSHIISVKESLYWTAFWVSLAMLFMVGIYFYHGGPSQPIAGEKALEFLAGYLIEESLSVDNLFVILLVFSYFKTHPEHQHKVLFWGIIGALVMRLGLIYVGIELIEHFDFVMYIFGGFLVFTGLRMAFGKEKELHPDDTLVVRMLKKIMPITSGYRGNHFFVYENAKRYATPLFVVVLVVEATDLVFALDSIPAILAVTRDPFIVYTSNTFALLGLRSLFFALSGVLDIFHYIKYGLALVLTFIGIKMILAGHVHISTGFSLSVVITILGISILASILRPQKNLP